MSMPPMELSRLGLNESTINNLISDISSRSNNLSEKFIDFSINSSSLSEGQS